MPPISFLAAAPLAIAALLALWVASHQAGAALFLACSAVAVLCMDCLAALLGKSWVSAAWLTTIIYAIAAEFMLLIIPSVKGVPWSVQTGFAGLTPAVATAAAFLVIAPFAIAAWSLIREKVR